MRSEIGHPLFRKSRSLSDPSEYKSILLHYMTQWASSKGSTCVQAVRLWRPHYQLVIDHHLVSSLTLEASRVVVNISVHPVSSIICQTTHSAFSKSSQKVRLWRPHYQLVIDHHLVSSLPLEASRVVVNISVHPVSYIICQTTYSAFSKSSQAVRLWRPHYQLVIDHHLVSSPPLEAWHIHHSH